MNSPSALLSQGKFLLPILQKGNQHRPNKNAIGASRRNSRPHTDNWYRHHHDANHREGICRLAAGILGDRVFEVAVKCLADARVQPLALDLKLICRGAFNWASLSGWDKLDLTRLEKLTFRPMARCLDERAAFPNATEAEMDVRACTALNRTLRKCSGRLEDLEIEDDSPLTWPTEYLILLPELLRLALDHIDSNTGALAKLLPLSPKLQHFELRGTHGLMTGMRKLLDAVRDHPSSMALEWYQVPSNALSDIGTHFNTAYASPARRLNQSLLPEEI